MAEPMRVLVVDDHALFRKGVVSLIDPLEDMEVVGEAGSGQEALEKATELMPDLILMDIQMPGWDGLETTRRIKEMMPYVKIVMLTISGGDGNLFQAIKSGAQGYLLKDIDPEELVKLLRGVYRGEAPISHLSAAKILEEFARLAENETWVPGPTEVLTARETEVLELVAEGARNKEIASQLFIAENTVKNHLSNILAKLHLRSRVQAAAYALRTGLIGNSPVEG
ncbi:MAG: response regulator transcription factor [Anaerolineae bacterium]|nr:response regulator transcription factor [Anaerolineae bacterium]